MVNIIFHIKEKICLFFLVMHVENKMELIKVKGITETYKKLKIRKRQLMFLGNILKVWVNIK